MPLYRSLREKTAMRETALRFPIPVGSEVHEARICEGVHPAAPVVSRTTTINASYPDTLGWLRFGEDLPARKPTGAYLKPGMVLVNR